MKRTLSRLILTICALLCPTLAFAQGVRWDGITLSPSGRPVAASVAVCTSPGLTTTAAQVIGNTAILTMSSNPITAGFAANMQIAASGFTGGDTYFNVGTLQPFVSTVTITAVSATTITYPLTHANASASTNGSVFQMGNVATPCAPLASIFSDAALAVPITQPGLSSSNIGNVGFYVNPGTYGIQFYGTGVTTYLQPLSLNMLFNGAMNIFYVDGSKYTTIAAAQAAGGSTNQFTGVIPSTDSETNCPALQNNNVWLDLRAGGRTGSGTSSFICTNNSELFNTKTPGLTDALFRSEMTRTAVDATGSIVSRYILAHLLNATVTGGSVDGASTQAEIDGTLSGTLNGVQGNESVAAFNSTGGGASFATGTIGYISTPISSTTLITNAYGLWGRGCAGTVLGTAPTNCYGGFFSRQLSTASGRNYAAGFEGRTLFFWDVNVNSGGFDCENSSHVPKPCFTIDGSNNTILGAIDPAGLILQDSTGANQLVLTNGGGVRINTKLSPFAAGAVSAGNAALPFSGFFYGAAATNNANLVGTFTAARTHTGPDASGTLLISGNGDGTHAIKNQSVRFSGVLGGTCPTAAAIGAACTSGNINWTTSFGDNSYAVVCTLNGTLTGQPHIVGTTYQAGGVGITITIAADTAAAANVAAAGFTHCIGIHD